MKVIQKTRVTWEATVGDVTAGGRGIEGDDFRGLEDIGDAIRRIVTAFNDETNPQPPDDYHITWTIGPGIVRLQLELGPNDVTPEVFG